MSVAAAIIIADKFAPASAFVIICYPFFCYYFAAAVLLVLVLLLLARLFRRKSR